MNEKQNLNSNMQYPKFKVNVQCATFQHAKYITDAMNGFTMQQTDFPFVCTIIDDASTDGEQDVICNYLDTHFDLSEDGVAYKKETDYAHIIYARHKTNKNCYFAVLFLKENHYSQGKDKKPYLKEWRENVDYIALCEGDDYWIDPLKLQKQVKILDNHPEYGAVYTDFEPFDNETKEIKKFRFVPRSGNCYEILLCFKLDLWTLTTCIRKEFYTGLPRIPDSMEAFQGDIHLFLHIASKSQVYCLNEKTARYRILKNSASHFTDKTKGRYFSYISANTILYYLQNGQDVSRKTRRKALTYICPRRIKYAAATNNIGILKGTRFPFSLIETPKQFFIFCCCHILRFTPILSFCHQLYKLRK